MKRTSKLLTWAMLCISTPLPLLAQKAPRYVLAGGYLYERPLSSSGSRFNANGWTVAPQYNFKSWLGAAVSVAGAYASPSGNPTRLYAFLAGPVVTLAVPHHKTVVPFAFANLGAAINRVNMGAAAGGWKTSNSFEVLYGAGLDYRFGHHFGIRLFEIANAITFFNNSTQYAPAISAGVVIKCGKV